MNLIICCCFCDCGKRETPRDESPGAKADLGQTEAGLEKSGKELMGRMGGDEAGDNRQA